MTYWAVTRSGQAVFIGFRYDIPPRPIYDYGNAFAVEYVEGVDFGRTVSPSRHNRVALAKAQRLEDFRKAMFACRSLTDRRLNARGEVEWDEADVDSFICGHEAGEHNANGCVVILEWNDYGPVYCGCEAYCKPAPLVLVNA